MRYYRSWSVYVTYCTYNRRTLHSVTNQHTMIEYLYGPTIYFPVNTYKNWQFSSGEHYRIISGYELYAAVIRVKRKLFFSFSRTVFLFFCENVTQNKKRCGFFRESSKSTKFFGENMFRPSYSIMLFLYGGHPACFLACFS